MKKDNLIYAIGTLIVVVAAIMQIFHLPGAEIALTIAIFTVPASLIYMAIENMRLKKRLKETEK